MSGAKVHAAAAEKIEIAFALARIANGLGCALPVDGTDAECMLAIEQALQPFLAAKACLQRADELLQKAAITNLVATSYAPPEGERRVHITSSHGAKAVYGGKGTSLQDALAQLLTAAAAAGA